MLTNNLYLAYVEFIEYCDPLGMSDHVSLLIYLNFESKHNSTLPKRMYYNGNYILMNEFFNNNNNNICLKSNIQTSSVVLNGFN